MLKNIGSSQGLHNVALSDKNSEDKFFIDSAGADSSLIDFGNNEFIKVKINKLDDYKIKNIKLLKRYISENGKILPSRITSVSQKKQRDLSISIKRARNLALI